MRDAVRPNPDISLDQRHGVSARIRTPTRAHIYFRFLRDSLFTDKDDISDLTLRNLSLHGSATDDVARLRVGMNIRLQIPLVGWRDAEVCWIDDGHAGCRFFIPIAQNALRDAIATSPLILTNFPDLPRHIEPADSRLFWPDDPIAAHATADRCVSPPRFFTGRTSRRRSQWRSLLMPVASIASAFFAWTTLYALLPRACAFPG